MELDPHTLQKILDRIKQQMRCPQCGKNVPIDFASVQVVSDDAMLLQLKCDSCNAFIVLHASLQGVEHVSEEPADAQGESDEVVNASSTLQVSKEELSTLSAALEQSGGSFEQMFKEYGSES